MAKHGKEFSQYIIVDYHNRGTLVYLVESDKEIELDDIVEYLEKKEDWSELTDGITIISKPTKIVLDEQN